MKSTSQHRRRRVRYDDVTEMFRRRFLFRDVGLEIFNSDGSTLLVVLEDKSEREKLLQELKKARKRSSNESSAGNEKSRGFMEFFSPKTLLLSGMQGGFLDLLLARALVESFRPGLPFTPSSNPQNCSSTHFLTHIFSMHCAYLF